MKRMLSSMGRAFSLAVAICLIAQSRAKAYGEILDFHDDLLPAGWTLTFLANSPGTNASIANNRFEAREVDTYAEISRPFSLSNGAVQLDISYAGNIEDVFYGMGSQIRLYDVNGYTVAGMGKTGFGIPLMNFFVGHENDGPPRSLPLDQSFAPDYGIYTLDVSFRNQQVSYSVRKSGSSSPLYEETVAVPELNLGEINRIAVLAVTTTGSTAWVDDVNVSTSPIPEPSTCMFGIVVLAALALRRAPVGGRPSVEDSLLAQVDR